MSKRRINSTGRKRIGLEWVRIEMLDIRIGEPLEARAELRLENMGFPASARVTIEAYHRSSGQWFDCGTIGAPNVPEVLVLDQVDKSGRVLFRVKVVDSDAEPGKILGSAERIRPRGKGEDDEGRSSIFPIECRDLGQETWKVVIEQGDRPHLIVNSRIHGFMSKLQGSALVQGLVLPVAMRFVLNELVQETETGEDDDEANWKDQWLEYCKNEFGVDAPARFHDPNERQNWIDDVVCLFCERFSLVDKVNSASGESE